MPTQPGSFVGKTFVTVKLQTLNFGDQLADGTHAKNDAKCPTVSEAFGKLPNVDQYKSAIGNGAEFVAYDCYIVAEATSTAGKPFSRNCTIASSAETPESYATCIIPHENHKVNDDWLSNLALNFTSEVHEYTELQNSAQP